MKIKKIGRSPIQNRTDPEFLKEYENHESKTWQFSPSEISMEVPNCQKKMGIKVYNLC